MNFRVLTLHPNFYTAFIEDGVFARAHKQGLVHFQAHSLRDYSDREDKRVDDRPFGGGEGMVIRADITKRALEDLRQAQTKIVFLAPAGVVFDSNWARHLSQERDLLFVCGRYEGFDGRVVESHADFVFSVGDYVLSSGDPAALIMIDSISRFVPGVLGNPQSSGHDSFEDGLLEAPCYTRPESFEGSAVPPVLLSGDHKRIADYRRKEQLRVTALHRPDLLWDAWERLSSEEVVYVKRLLKVGKKVPKSQ